MEKRVSEIKRARRHSAEFKATAVEKMKKCDNIVALSRELKVHWRMLYRWKAAADGAEAAARQNTPEQREAALQAENTRLKIALADKALELDFFRGALQKIETLRHKHAPNGGEASTNRSGT
jgi:transposase-like protein